MAKIMKLWTGLGIAAATSAALAGAAFASDAPQGVIMLAQTTEAAGEGGGEAGGDIPAEYSLSSSDANAYAFDASVQVKAYGELAQSSYAEAARMAQAAEDAITAFLKAPSEATLADARKAWVAARPSYLVTEAFRFYDGPIEEVEGRINAWPMNEAHVDYVEGKPDAGIINDPSKPLTLEAINGLDQSGDEANVTTGWHAVEFLLWGQDLSADGPGNRAHTDYLPGKASNERRRSYLKLVTRQLVEDIGWLAKKWDAGAPKSYGAHFAALEQREALGRMINGMAILTGFEFMSQRLAVALDSGDQEDEHSCFSDTTHQDFVYDLAGIKAVWTGDSNGKSRAGLDELVRSQDAALADKIDGLLADAEAKIAGLGDPWDQVLASAKDSPGRKDAEAVVAALQALGGGLVEAGNKLGVLVLIPSGS